jgi:hypothetical protein
VLKLHQYAPLNRQSFRPLSLSALLIAKQNQIKTTYIKYNTSKKKSLKSRKKHCFVPRLLILRLPGISLVFVARTLEAVVIVALKTEELPL